MPSTFRQDKINIRERLNALENHHHDQLYEPKGLFVGKNILINGDKSICERDDFSTPVSATNLEYYIDRYYTAISGVTANVSQETPMDEGGVNSILITATSTATGYMQSVQKIENGGRFNGQLITYTAKIRSNKIVTININDDGTSHLKRTTKGNGEWEEVSLTFLKKETTLNAVFATYVSTRVELGTDTSIVTGDYFEVGNEQLEIGDKFTGFEDVPTTINLSNCQRYCFSLRNATLGMVGLASGISSTSINVVVPFPVTMRVEPTLTVQNGHVLIYGGGLNGYTPTSTDLDSSVSVNVGVINFDGTFVEGTSYSAILASGSTCYFDAEP